MPAHDQTVLNHFDFFETLRTEILERWEKMTLDLYPSVEMFGLEISTVLTKREYTSISFFGQSANEDILL
jgi:hypothetical protein